MKWRVVQVDGEPLFAVDAAGYEALSRDLAEVARFMREASWQIQFYRQTRQPTMPQGSK
jgi:hypothetical protein